MRDTGTGDVSEFDNDVLWKWIVGKSQYNMHHKTTELNILEALRFISANVEVDGCILNAALGAVRNLGFQILALRSKGETTGSESHREQRPQKVEEGWGHSIK